MKAISLWQPWASGVALLHKGVETRGRPTNYHGPIAIHAALRFGREQRAFAAVECSIGRLPTRLPLGAVVCIAFLHDCRPAMEVLPTIGPVEKLYVDYRPGRWAWRLRDVVPLLQPLPFKGKQGFFEVPDDLLRPLAPAWYERAAA